MKEIFLGTQATKLNEYILRRLSTLASIDYICMESRKRRQSQLAIIMREAPGMGEVLVGDPYIAYSHTGGLVRYRSRHRALLVDAAASCHAGRSGTIC
mmetsp:Transcript_8112/g.22634  ORF Transcript_8112/g.22634 Transcript_8112/m.22634 type:complete len:98 (+) Transcript_8112:230-523(+)